MEGKLLKNNYNTEIKIKTTRDKLLTHFYQTSLLIKRWKHISDNYANFYRQMSTDDPSASY